MTKYTLIRAIEHLTARHTPTIGVLRELKDGNIVGTDIVGAILVIAKQAEEQMGGTSGALYS